jgi:hypothetical protein
MPESAHDWFRPRLQALVAEGQQAGFARDVAVAVITDLMNGALSAPVPAGGDDDWNRDIGEPDSAVNGAPTQDPAAGPSYGGPVADPLQHVGHRFVGSRPK